MKSLAYIPGSDGSGDASLMTITQVRTAPATSITVNTTAGVPAKFFGTMGTPHTFSDPVTGETITVISEATAVNFAGHIDSGKVEIDAIADGETDLGSKVGDIIVIRPTTQWANNLHDVLAESHNDDGSLKDDIVTTAKVKDRAITAPKIDFATLATKFLLAYAQRTTSFAFGATAVDNPGMSITFTTTEPMPVTIEFWASQAMTGQTAATRVDTYITNGSNETLATSYPSVTSAMPTGAFTVKKVYQSLPAGTHTFKVRHVTPAGTGTIYAGSEAPMYIKASVG